jgi:hypothetical protein
LDENGSECSIVKAQLTVNPLKVRDYKANGEYEQRGRRRCSILVSALNR